MNSAGNDIVALRAVDKQRTHYNRFYSKILSDTEHSFYRRQQPAEISFENFVWLLWSVKESVYKYLKRASPDLVFSPTKIIIDKIYSPQEGAAGPFCCPPDGIFEGGQWESRMTGPGKEFYRGIAIFKSRAFYFRSILCPEFISTVVNAEENFENIWWGIKSIDHSDYHHQSTAVRAFVLNQLNTVFSAGKLQIGRSPLGYPIVLNDTEEMKIPLSFAHHDCFVTYSFSLEDS
jgi:phosphopantetheinyl transferase (holo-ACP synthase)